LCPYVQGQTVQGDPEDEGAIAACPATHWIRAHTACVDAGRSPHCKAVSSSVWNGCCHDAFMCVCMCDWCNV